MSAFIDQLTDQIQQLEDEEARLRSQLDELRGRKRGLREALRLFRGEGPAQEAPRRRGRPPSEGTRVPDPSKNQGWAAVLLALETAPARGHDVDTLENATKSSNVHIVRATLRAMLSRAAKEGVVERVSVGHYRLPQKDEPHDGNERNSLGTDQEDIGSSQEAPIKGTLGNPTPFSSKSRDLLSGTSMSATHTKNFALAGNDEAATSSFPTSNPNRRPA